MGKRFYEYLLTMNQLFSEVYFSQKVDTIFCYFREDKCEEGQTVKKCAQSFTASK